MMLTNHNTIDLYHKEDWPTTIKGVVIYTENEYGCASHIASKGILGDQEPSGRILTHLINQMVFNQSVDFESVGWPYYFYEGYLIVNINKWPSTPIMPLQEAQATWIYCYPPVRDLISFLYKKYGDMGKGLYYMTSTTLHDSLNTDIFAVHPPDELIFYNHKNGIKSWHSPKQNVSGNLTTDLFFAPPSWLFPHLAHEMGVKNCLTVFSGHDPESGDIDEVAALTLFRWLNKFTEKTKNKHAFNRALKDTKKEVDDALAMRADFERVLEKAQQQDAPNMLWG